jgi:GTPase
MKFVDYVTITVRSGKGGPGHVSFRREKYEPFGGPSGGDGGKGGSVILTADTHLYTLLDLRYNRHHFAENGQPGGKSNKSGKDGADIVLRVPLGTLARDAETNEVLAEVIDPGDQAVLAKGGRGGKGNTFFKSATNRAPQFAQPGEEGEERQIVLELKLLADVGLVGFPNAGKSTLISSISAARPKVADYPFTTLEPNLGVVGIGEYQSFVMADIPGIIEGASEGKGLGIRFLKHIERNAVLLFLIPIDSTYPGQEYRTLLGELEAFNPELLEKPRMVALSKVDLFPGEDREALLESIRAEFPDGVNPMAISSVSGHGLDGLKRTLWAHIEKARQEIA